jgi:hypothetical protein
VVRFEALGNFASILAALDLLSGKLDLQLRQFGLAPEFYAPVFCGLHSGAGSYSSPPHQTSKI